MQKGLDKHTYLIELDFSNYDPEMTQKDIDALKCELFEDVSVVLSRLVEKYNTLIGFHQGVFIASPDNDVICGDEL